MVNWFMIRRILILVLTLVLVITNLPLSNAKSGLALAVPHGANRQVVQLAPGQVLPPPCPQLIDKFLFPPKNRNFPAVPMWNLPAYSGDPALEPLPNGFTVNESDAWFDGIPLKIRVFPRPGVGDGGPTINHADMYVFYYPDGTPVNQLPLISAVPKNAAGPGALIDNFSARMFSANWEVHAVRVTATYVPGTIKSLDGLANPNWVLEDIATNMYITFPVLPPGTSVPDLGLNGLSLDAAFYEGLTVMFVEYDIQDRELTEKPMYIFRKPNGEFAGLPVVSSGIPGMPHYNALWNVGIVEVPQNYVADTLRAEDAILASGYQIREAFEVFAPVTAVDGKRTVFHDKDTILLGPDGKFHKERFPIQMRSPAQPFDNDPRITQAVLGFTNNFSIVEVAVNQLELLPAALLMEDVLLAILKNQFPPSVCNQIKVPPHIARQFLIQDSLGNLIHQKQSEIDAMPLAEVVTRGQAIFEREIFEDNGAGPAFNTYSCATCHGEPFNIGIEPLTGGAAGRFRNAMQPTDKPDPNIPSLKVKRSRNTPHVFGSGILTQLGKERHAGGLPATNDNPWPHNWKGTVPTVRDFTAGAMKGEIGLESVEKVAELTGKSLAEAATIDNDNDGIVNEMTVGDVTAVTAFQANLPRPYQIKVSDPNVIKGRKVFETTGCIFCHTPVQTLQSTILEIPNPETSGVVKIPLGAQMVELYSDLKRHRMGALLAETGDQDGIPADMFRTQPLWGIGDTAPYLHDGSADTLEEAILKHGGAGSEALPVVNNFNALSAQDKSDLFSFLNSLVLPRHQELERDFYLSLTPRDKGLMGPFLKSFIRVVPDFFLSAWIVNLLDGGKVNGSVKVQVSINSEFGTSQATLLVDNITVLPLSYNSATGFHEATVNTIPLSEGEHKLSIDVVDKKGNRLKGVNSIFVTVDNILDNSPLNWPSNWSGKPKDCVCIGTGLMAG